MGMKSGSQPNPYSPGKMMVNTSPQGAGASQYAQQAVQAVPFMDGMAGAQGMMHQQGHAVNRDPQKEMMRRQMMAQMLSNRQSGPFQNAQYTPPQFQLYSETGY